VADFANDLDILNYALTLEHFESAMYKAIAASGKLTGTEQQYAVGFGSHEAAHVTALTDTITKAGGTPVKAQASYNFPAFDTRDNIVKFLVTVEDLGASAYLGAAPEIKDPGVLTAAVAIHNIEGEHASIWRRAAKLAPVEGAFATPTKRADVLAAVTPFLGGGGAAGTAAPAAAATVRPAATGTGGGTGATTVATATRPAATTAAATTRPAATGTGGGTAATATRPAGTALPTTGNPQSGNTGIATAVLTGLAAVGVGAVLRSRSYKRGATAK